MIYTKFSDLLEKVKIYDIDFYNHSDNKVFLPNKNDYDIKKILDVLSKPTMYSMLNGCKTVFPKTAIVNDNNNKYEAGFMCRNIADFYPKLSYYYKYSFKGVELNEQSVGVRPCAHISIQSFLDIKKQDANLLQVDDVVKKSILGPNYTFNYQTLTLGEYPQEFADDKIAEELENSYQNHTLRKTGRKWLGYSKNGDIKHTQNEEYIYNGEKYIRSNHCLNLSYDTTIMGYDYKPWIKVEPLKWQIKNWYDLPKEINPVGNGSAKYIDIQTDKTIISGVPYSFNNNTAYSVCDIKSFMQLEILEKALNMPIDKSLAESEIYVSSQNVLEEEETIVNDVVEEHKSKNLGKRTKLEKLNPDKTAYNRTSMTDTELIKYWIDSGQSVLLRGPSGIGKTERIKSLYPNLIYLKLTNNMFPEKVVGSTNLQTGETIPPEYAKQAILQCATDEEKELVAKDVQNIYKIADAVYERSKTRTDKVVILLDELLNVRPNIQSLVYTLVLNKEVEVGGGLKLPDNTVIVATGNQKKYSGVAEEIAEPLEKRFDHIVDMRPKVGEWLYDYAIPNKVHPAVVGYIMTQYIMSGKNESISAIDYFYEEPEVGEEHLDLYGSKGRTNDPRGWVSISNMLYNFEKDLKDGKFVGKNVENILVASLGTKLRGGWAESFMDFYNEPILTVEEVVNGDYTFDDLPKDSNERFACVASLVSANEDEVEICRSFISKFCNPEYLAIYDIYWAGHDEKRLEKIAELNCAHKKIVANTINKNVNQNSGNKKVYAYKENDFSL